MKIAIDVSPLQSGHKVRGVGFYLENVKRALLTYFPENDYVFFSGAEYKKLDSDIDVVHYPYFDPFQLTLPFQFKFPTVVTVHDLTPIVFPEHFPAGLKGKLKWQIQKNNLKRVNAIITDSLASKNDIHRLTGISDAKVSVAYLAASDEFKIISNAKEEFKLLQKKYNLPDKFVLYVGDVTWNKNLPRLLRAVKQLKLPLVLVGKAIAQKEFDKSNAWKKDLVEIQSLTQGDGAISVVGFIPNNELVTLYNLATVFVWPSVYEGFGLPIVEAMQSGCPVIVSREGCMPEVAGDAGYYFNGYETDSLVDAIDKVYHSKELQKELAQKGISQAKKFSWKQTAEGTIKVYKNVLHK